MDVDERFYPYRTTPMRLALDTVEAIASAEGIARVALLGAIADDRQDGHAIVDLLAAAETPEAAVTSITNLHAALPLRFYCPSPDSPAPSGAYWLTGESPFHRIEVEFAEPDDYAFAVRAAQAMPPGLLVRGARRLVREIEPCERRLPTLIDGLPDVLAPTAREERSVSEALVRSLDRMVEYLRGRGTIEPLTEAMAVLNEAYDAAGRPWTTAHGHLGGLVEECRELWNILHLAHLRAATGVELREPERLSG